MKTGIKYVLGLSLVFLLSSCSNRQNFLDPASPTAQKEAHLYWIVFFMALAVFLIVEGLLIVNILRFRHNQHVHEMSPSREVLLETIWTVIPLILVAILFFLTVRTMNAVAAPKPTQSDLNVRVVAHRWWWEFQYPDLGIDTADELHIPLNANVQITLESADVVHSFWVSALAGKTDVIPGVTNHMWLHGDKIGEYDGQCAEYCGLNHATMRFKVFVDSQDDFNAWVQNQQQPPPDPQTDLQKQGYALVAQGVCSGCHTIGSQTALEPIGPNLTHLFSRTTFAGASFDLNQANLRRWVENSNGMKPGNLMQDIHVPLDQVDAVIAYLSTLK
jgi:cytochrome c oxidase subunit 2